MTTKQQVADSIQLLIKLLESYLTNYDNIVVLNHINDMEDLLIRATEELDGAECAVDDTKRHLREINDSLEELKDEL